MGAAETIRETRERAGLTQAALARRAGTSQPMIARYESGAASPTVRTLQRLLKAAGCDLLLSTRGASESNASGQLAAVLHEHRTAIRDEAAAIGARNVRVFGSVARGEDATGSDVDLLVDFPVRRRGLLPLITLATRIEELVGRPVDIATTDMMKDDVRTQALRDAVPL